MSDSSSHFSGPVPDRSSRIVSAVLSPAVRLWLRSQLEAVTDLQFKIEGSDRQLLSGYIPQVRVAARQAVYRGLHLSQIQLTATRIRINLGQIVKGKPLRLLDSFPIAGTLCLQETDFNASLAAPLLNAAVSGFLVRLLQTAAIVENVGKPTVVEMPPRTPQIRQQIPALEPLRRLLQSSNSNLRLANASAAFEPERLTLSGTLVAHGEEGSEDAELAGVAIALRTGLKLASPHELQLNQPHLLPHASAPSGIPLTDPEGLTLDLGSGTNLQTLTLESGQLNCQGSITVTP